MQHCNTKLSVRMLLTWWLPYLQLASHFWRLTMNTRCRHEYEVRLKIVQRYTRGRNSTYGGWRIHCLPRYHSASIWWQRNGLLLCRMWCSDWSPRSPATPSPDRPPSSWTSAAFVRPLISSSPGNHRRRRDRQTFWHYLILSQQLLET